MSFNNSKDEIFETSLKNQSEMQPCKLNVSESKPNMALRKIGHELDIAETKCSTLKSELNYMMGVCRKARMETTGSKDTLHPHSRSVQFPHKKIADDDDVIEKTTNLIEEKQKGLLNITVTPRAQLDKKFPLAAKITPNRNETVELVRYTEKQADREYESLLSCYPEHVQEHLQRSALSAEESFEELASKMDEDYFCMIRPSTITTKDLADLGLNLEISDTAKARHAETGSKRATRANRRQTNSFYKTGDASKVRKRKGKLRSSASKSTVATKDTNYIGKKEAKRRKHKDIYSAGHQQSGFSKHLRRSSDVVEIFHNTTLNSSNSGVSGKYSKLDGQTRKHLGETANEKIQGMPFTKRVNHEFHNKEDQQDNHPRTLNYPSDFKETPVQSLLQQQNTLEKLPDGPCLSTQAETQQCEHAVSNKCNDPIFAPNYGMSTLASRLKRSNRSSFNRFNFQSIPFVVGTSITPSHNLGLNIQQVLSVMKMRQPMTNNVSPLLIRKVNRGMKPASILLEQMNGHDEELVLGVNSQITGLFSNKENSDDDRGKKLPVLDLQRAGKVQNVRQIPSTGDMTSTEDNEIFKQFREKKNGSYENHKIKQQQSLSAINKRNLSANMKNQQKISRLSLNKEDNIGDYKVRIPGSHNSKQIRDILINLHDQFEEMNTKYEKLQSEIEKKSNDVSLTKELSILEKELNIKEEEISAVIGLYKEVMTLKQQMKMLHEKNSFVCIESPKEFHKSPFPISIIHGKPHSMNSTQIFERGQAYATRKPPTSIQLTALLRQIQAFHKQLQLVS